VFHALVPISLPYEFLKQSSYVCKADTTQFCPVLIGNVFKYTQTETRFACRKFDDVSEYFSDLFSELL